MINVAGNTLEPGALSYPSGSTEALALSIMEKSNATYRYGSLGQLKFELKLRANIVNASKDLNRSNMAFRVFRKSKANPDFWYRTNEGGFRLQPDVSPWDAINDIYKNSSLYGTECATAMVIVYYKALADILPEDLFNRLFPDIYLMNWQHLDRDLGISRSENPPDYLPGDARYFKNPDVNPLHPEWQGENVFDLGNELYYGHGLGIATKDRIIESLNSLRKEEATRSAYLMDFAERPGFRQLHRKYEEYMQNQAHQSD